MYIPQNVSTPSVVVEVSGGLVTHVSGTGVPKHLMVVVVDHDALTVSPHACPEVQVDVWQELQAANLVGLVEALRSKGLL